MKKYILLSLLFFKMTIASSQATMQLEVISYVSNVLTFKISLTPTTPNPFYLGNMTVSINNAATNIITVGRTTAPTYTNIDGSIVASRPLIQTTATPGLIKINYGAPIIGDQLEFNSLVARITSKTSLGTYTVTFNGAQTGTLSCGGVTISSFTNDEVNGFPLSPVTTICSGSIVLPLDLLSFSASANNKFNKTTTELKWQTANELNTQSFDIERSANGKTFEKVGNVKSVGTARGTYQFTDEVPLTGLNYYRLKMMDLDGSFTYSPIRSLVLGEGKTTNVSIAPNPTKGDVTVKLNADDAKTVTLVLVDITGKTVLTERKKLEMGFNQLSLSLSDYPQGLYFLKIVDANTTESHRLVIAN